MPTIAEAPAGRPRVLQPTHRDDIQGLRAVAVLLVVLAHAGLSVVPGGFVGVDVFFVLSGFLITGLLLTEARQRGSVSLGTFYVRRARRILPAAALTLVVTDAAAFFLLNFVRADQAVHDSLFAAAFASNFRFAARGVNYFAESDPPSPILHYWSLSVEEQFYFVWPLLLTLGLFGLAVGRRRRRGPVHERRLLALVGLLSLLSFAFSLHLTRTEPTVAYFSPWTRAWELGLGATLAVGAATLSRTPGIARLVLGWVGLTAIALSAVLLTEATPFPGTAALLPTVGTALAIIAGMGAGTTRFSVSRLLSLRPMLIVGDRSYALYLWHWPVLILAQAYAGDELSVAAKLGLMVAAFLLSCVSYALVENPIRRKVRGRWKTALVVAVSMTALLGAARASHAGIESQQQRFEARFAASAPLGQLSVDRSNAQAALPAVVAAVEAARRGAPLPSPLVPPLRDLKRLPPKYAPPNECIAHDSSSVSTSAVCRLGVPASRKLLVLMGDSHAYMWLPPVLELARRDGWTVVPLLRLGCTPFKWTTNMGTKACRDWYRWALTVVDRLEPRVTLLAGSIDQRQTPAARAAIEGIVAAAATLERLGPTVVIGDPEGLDRNPVDCLLSRNATMETCTTTWPGRSLAAYDEVARRVRAVGAGHLATRGFVCYEGSCPAVIGRTIAWADDNHLSAAYSTRLAGAFRLGFVRALSTSRR